MKLIILLIFIGLFYSCKTKNLPETASDEITVASYYFPNYHIRREGHLPLSNQPFLDNRSEWELVKAARPRFEGHQQPHVPAWGYTDEKDPIVMEMKIKAASENGVDVFIFDWYMYNNQPFLNDCLDSGFLKAKNTEKLKFALMWANHDWKDLFPVNRNNLNELEVMYPGKVTPEEFEKIGDDIISQYFTKPNYWLIDGKAYFSIYDVEKFIESFGSKEATRAAMVRLNEKAMEKGLKGVHWNLVAWGNPILPGEKVPSDLPGIISDLGFQSATSYVWIHHVKLPDQTNDYNMSRDAYFTHWEKAVVEYGVPYYPNVSMGWDSSPRTNQSMDWDHNAGYPYTGVIVNNTPENFRSALEMTKERMLANPAFPRIFTINCWNEWTEGSYLEPDTVNGMAYLHALKDVFGND